VLDASPRRRGLHLLNDKLRPLQRATANCRISCAIIQRAASAAAPVRRGSQTAKIDCRRNAAAVVCRSEFPSALEQNRAIKHRLDVLFRGWELKAVSRDPRHPRYGRPLGFVRQRRALLDRIISEQFSRNGVYGFWPAASEDDTSSSTAMKKTGELVRSTFCGTGSFADGKPTCRSPISSRLAAGTTDYLGAFAVTAVWPTRSASISEQRRLQSILMKASQNRLRKASRVSPRDGRSDGASTTAEPRRHPPEAHRESGLGWLPRLSDHSENSTVRSLDAGRSHRVDREWREMTPTRASGPLFAHLKHAISPSAVSVTIRCARRRKGQSLEKSNAA